MKAFCLKILLLVGLILMVQSCKEDQVDLSLLKDAENPVVKMETTMGDLFIELFRKEAPISVDNFITYSKEGFYEGTIFHRVINSFMVQGGGFTPDFEQKETHDPIKNEALNGLKNERGTLAMARTQVVDSATSQFFINVVDNDFLNYTGNSPQQFGYAVFGRVVEGLDVVDAIKQVKTTSKHPYDDVPVSDIVIEKVVLIQQ